MSDQPTPMMAQYLSIKADYADALLFYRMGDFYELFFDDARDAAEILDITLTHRGKHKGAEIPMCGVPAHSHEAYLHRLIQTGRHVAICEQTEDPTEAKKRGAKSVVKREVVRLVTPGTLTEENLLDGRSHNFLAAYVMIRDAAALAWADISTGELNVTSIDGDLDAKLAAIQPGELIIPEGFELPDDLDVLVPYVSPISRSSFDVASAETRLKRLFDIASLDAFGAFNRAHISALGGIVDYLSITQIEGHGRLRTPRLISGQAQMHIDAATRRNLELLQSLSGGRQGSLIATINKTRTAMGSRRFEERLNTPLREIETIKQRHDIIAATASLNTQELSASLSKTPDFERALTRLLLGRGSPRDLRLLGDGLSLAMEIGATLKELGDLQLEPMGEVLTSLGELAKNLTREITDQPPATAREGGFINGGVYPELDEFRELRDNARAIIAQTQSEYSKFTGISALKIKSNNVLGFFVEVPATHANHMLSDEMKAQFIHRQTTANALRFTSTKLAELETRIGEATEKAIAFEKGIFSDWINKIIPHSAQIDQIVDSIGELDIACVMADLADQGWCRPELHNDQRFSILAGRHPVVEQAIRDQGEDFIANDCILDEPKGKLWLITGPNMAGKSTFLRQNAIITILAQCGFYVPANSAEIGIVDKIFSRIGAADDLARGRSTFMVEMIETAAILNQATENSLVILDEIGRGTATYDGLALAWSVLEYLLDRIACRGLFATHFHELASLKEQHNGLYPAHVAIREWQGDIVFLHQIQGGIAARSYGVDVAKLAGLPQVVVERARNILERLEADGQATELSQLPLFQAEVAIAPSAKSETLAQLRELSPDFMTPRKALDVLYKLVDHAKFENDL